MPTTPHRRPSAGPALRGALCVIAALLVASCEGAGSLENQDETNVVDELGDSSSETDSTTDAQIEDSLVLAAEASERSGDWEGAVQYWQRLLQRDPANARYAAGLGDSLRRIGRYDEAVQVLRVALERSPEAPLLVASYGKALLASGHRDEAIVALEQSVRTDPLNWQVQSALAIAYGMGEQNDLADQHFRQALALAPDNPVVQSNYALHLAITGRLDAGIELMEQAASSLDATTQVRQNLAVLYAVDGDLEAAEELVRAELPDDEAELQMAYLRTLSTDDLADLSGLIEESGMTIDAETLAAPAPEEEAASVVDLTNLEASDPDFLLDQPGAEVIEEEILVAPSAEPSLAEVLDGTADPGGSSLATEVADDELAGDDAAAVEAEVAAATAGQDADARAAADQAALAAQLSDMLDQGGTGTDTGAAVAELPSPPSEAEAEALAEPATPLETADVAASDTPAPPPEDDRIVATMEPVADDVAAGESVAEVVEAIPPVDAEPAAAVAADAATGERMWRVQLASLPTEADAQRGRDDILAAQGAVLDAGGVAIRAATLDDGATTWRVFAGAFAEKAGADELCARVKANGGDCLVIRDPAAAP